MALHLRWNVHFKWLEYSRHQICQTYKIGHNYARRSTWRMPARQMNDERHMQRRVINKEPVSFFSVLAQAFPMIPAQDNQRIGIQALGLKKSNQTPDLRVRKRNLSIVRAIFVLFAVRSGRAIRVVGIV